MQEEKHIYMKNLYTAQEAADLLGIERRWFYHLAKSYEPSQKIGTNYLWDKKVVDKIGKTLRKNR